MKTIEMLDLDNAAKANLNDSQLNEYEKYKKILINDGEPQESIEAILTGWIWGEIEYID